MKVLSVAEQLLFTTVRVETYDDKNNAYTGTSFIFGYRTGKDEQILFLVTNKHVIKGKQKGILNFIQAQNGQPLLGTCYPLEITEFESAWYGHPSEKVDVAIAYFKPIVDCFADKGIDIYFRSVISDLVPSNDILNELDAIEEVLIIGYPYGIWDRKNLLPIVRRGITATPISVDFQGEKQFLIDASVFPGSSGSPVFLYNVGTYTKKTGDTVVENRLLFLGIVAEVFYRIEPSEIRVLSVPTVDVPVALSKQMIDLGIVFQATTIIEAIELYIKERGITKG